MADTTNLELPLVAGGQAQKHITVNEALARLDALLPGVIVSRTVSSAPSGADGSVYLVPGGAGGDWTDQGGKLAVGLGGGWAFVAPQDGWSGWCADEGVALRYVAGTWAVEGRSASGAGTALEVIEIEHDIPGPGSHDTAPILPAKGMVLAVTGIVLDEIAGTAASWKVGTAGALDRFGSGLGTARGSWSEGVLGTPVTYWSRSPLTLTPEGGDWTGGRIRLAAHVLRFQRPTG